MMSKPKRLHPAAVILHIVIGIRNSLFFFILLFVTLFDDKLLYAFLAMLALLLLIIITSVLTWQRFTYRVEEDELRLEYGIIIRKKRFISKHRIQSIDLTQNILHRIFKLTKVEIETAGTGAEAEASLICVTLTEGEALRAELKSISSREQHENEIEEEAYLAQTITRKQLLLAGATSGSIGVLLAIAGFAFSEIERFIPANFYDDAYRWIIGLGLLIMVLFIVGTLLLLWLLGIIGTMIKYWNFTITKVDEDIVITRGLLEKKQITIPLKRIQAVGYAESVIRQPFGYATVIAEIAGGSNEKGEDFSTVLFPIMKVEEVEAFLEKFLPMYVNKQNNMQSLPKRARKYYIIRMTIPALLLLGVVFFVFPHLSWIPLILLAVCVGLSLLQHKDAGYLINGQKLLIRYRNINKVTMVLHHKRIQAFNKKQNWFHRKENLARLKLSIIGKMGLGKHYTIKELDVTDVDDLSDWYSYRKKG
ncbi:PH domain-containing protein [Ornithinibacillus bavariensis]|uniref:PH domain-containing protein n=1 Tax=Ornithinibacillus bavariensis TaxID=545502 RepID=UPI003D2302AB